MPHPTLNAVIDSNSLNGSDIKTPNPVFNLTLNKPMDIEIKANDSGETTISSGISQNKSSGNYVEITGLATGKSYTFTITGEDNNSAQDSKTITASTASTGPQVSTITVSSNDTPAKSAVKDGDKVKVDVTFNMALGAVPNITMLLPDGTDIKC